jgi:hypothetical protein
LEPILLGFCQFISWKQIVSSVSMISK